MLAERWIGAARGVADVMVLLLVRRRRGRGGQQRPAARRPARQRRPDRPRHRRAERARRACAARRAACGRTPRRRRCRRRSNRPLRRAPGSGDRAHRGDDRPGRGVGRRPCSTCASCCSPARVPATFGQPLLDAAAPRARPAQPHRPPAQHARPGAAARPARGQPPRAGGGARRGGRARPAGVARATSGRGRTRHGVTGRAGPQWVADGSPRTMVAPAHRGRRRPRRARAPTAVDHGRAHRGGGDARRGGGDTARSCRCRPPATSGCGLLTQYGDAAAVPTGDDVVRLPRLVSRPRRGSVSGSVRANHGTVRLTGAPSTGRPRRIA